MELDDLKNDWVALSNQTANNNNLTPKVIDQMTQKKYHGKINKIKYPELIGGIVCLFGLCFIVFNFYKLDTIFLQVVGITTILLLVILPTISFLSVRQFNLNDDVNKPYADSIKQFAYQKLRFQKYQRANVLLSYLLLVTVIILFPKFFFEKNITGSKYFWGLAFSFGYIFLTWYTKRVKKFYSKTLKQAEELLSEVASNS